MEGHCLTHTFEYGQDKEMEITGLERPNEAYESETPEEIREALDRVVAKLVLGEDLTDEQVRVSDTCVFI